MLIHSRHYIEGKIQAIFEVVFPAFDLNVALPLFSMVNYEHSMLVITVNLSSWKYSLQYNERSLQIWLHLRTKRNNSSSLKHKRIYITKIVTKYNKIIIYNVLHIKKRSIQIYIISRSIIIRFDNTRILHMFM